MMYRANRIFITLILSDMKHIKDFLPSCNHLVRLIYNNNNFILKKDEIKGKTYCVMDNEKKRLITDFLKPKELYIYLNGYYQGMRGNLKRVSL